MRTRPHSILEHLNQLFGGYLILRPGIQIIIYKFISEALILVVQFTLRTSSRTRNTPVSIVGVFPPSGSGIAVSMFWWVKSCYWDFISLSIFRDLVFTLNMPLLLRYYWGECNHAVMIQKALSYFVVPQGCLPIVLQSKSENALCFKLLGVWLKTISEWALMTIFCYSMYNRDRKDIWTVTKTLKYFLDGKFRWMLIYIFKYSPCS